MNAFLVASLLGLGLGAAGADEKEPVWLNDYAEARAVARRTDRPIFVVFR